VKQAYRYCIFCI